MLPHILVHKIQPNQKSIECVESLESYTTADPNLYQTILKNKSNMHGSILSPWKTISW